MLPVMTHKPPSRKIAIIEDDPDLGPLFAEILEEFGYSVTLIADGALALEGVLRFQPDLIILDMHLPHVSGMDILRQLRADERLRVMPVIVASANTTLIDQSRELADKTLLKPISLDSLLNTAEELLGVPNTL